MALDHLLRTFFRAEFRLEGIDFERNGRVHLDDVDSPIVFEVFGTHESIHLLHGQAQALLEHLGPETAAAAEY